MVDTGAEGPPADWSVPLTELCARIRTAVRTALADGSRRDDVTAIVGRGAGDATFAIDAVAEEAVTTWLGEVALQGPLSLMTEHVGWRHVGPAPGGGAMSLEGFDHGGPRIALDPIDGTRNVMHDLRSAWIVVSFAGPGEGVPRFGEQSLGIVSEIPDTRARFAREFDARQGRGAGVTVIDLARDDARSKRTAITCDDDERADLGYFPFFGYEPTGRAHAQELAARVIDHVASRAPEIDESTILDDQYISSGGQLVLLALGTYRLIVDARVSLNALHGEDRQTAKPYDVAGALLVAREAGCTIVRPDGGELDFEMDVVTPVEFAGFHNEATRDRWLPALSRTLDTGAPGESARADRG